MEFDLTHFPADRTERIRALSTPAELDRYTYLVAGCVGEFWTDITMAHTYALQSWDRDRMVELGVRFGKALQMTNVLRDVPGDLRAGRCYLPREWLDPLGLSPQDLLDPANSLVARPAMCRGVEMALGHFEEAERYLMAVPRRCVRLRLATAWPLLMGLATLWELARNSGWLNPDSPAKVSRSWIYRMIGLSTLVGHSNWAISSWVRALRRRVRSALGPTSG